MIVRPAQPGDAAAMADLQNEIIRQGTTTAHVRERDADTVAQAYITGPGPICCHVAEEAGAILGFQVVGRNPDLPAGCGDIGTFVRMGVQARGIGGALFAASREAALAAGLSALNATIRSDNVPGLAYYGRLGFRDVASEPGYALADGRITGRVHRRLTL